MTNNNAKFTFYYLLSLVSLFFTALSSGMILFQIINQKIIDSAAQVFQGYSDSTMRFAIAALFVSAPVYFLVTRTINKNVISGALEREGATRKWLTYFIFFVTSVTALGWFIGTINMFLNGELSIKFILKLATIILITGSVFAFYLYDIRRQIIAKTDKGFKIFSYAGLSLVLIIFIASWFFVDSPRLARARRIDNLTINELNTIESLINDYYAKHKSLPADLETARKEFGYFSTEQLIDFNNQPYSYKPVTDKSYELCAEFMASSEAENANNKNNYSYSYPQYNWEHQVGGDCFTRDIKATDQANPAKF